MEEGLWGTEIDSFIELVNKDKTKEVLNKIRKPKAETKSPEKQLKSKVVPLSEKIKIITEKVNSVLGKQKNNISVIYDKEQLLNYMKTAIDNGIIAVDTETNNSLDPITCKLMGLCLYTTDQKQVYVPINHVNPETNERLSNQLTEKDCAIALGMLVEAKPIILMHNGKFDYEVLKCTCGIEVVPTWDTLLGAKLINEDEEANLKKQYIMHVDPEQEKYSIEGLFEKQQYAVFPPELFALYAATDALMTFKLFDYQYRILKKPENKRVLDLLLNVEMPCVQVVAEMELAGVTVDLEYAKRLSDKYHAILDDVTNEINKEIEKIQPQIDAWRNTTEANQSVDGKKSKVEQLDENINLDSPAQLAILLYDILKTPVIDTSKPRGTGEDILKAINLPICKLLLKRRELVKLISTYIDVIPELANRWADGRVRTHFNQYGAATGRFSSSEPLNLQNIPSHNKEIRMLFSAQCKEDDIEIDDDNYYNVSSISEVLTSTGWKRAKEIAVGDIICGDTTTDVVKQVLYKGSNILLYV